MAKTRNTEKSIEVDRVREPSGKPKIFISYSWTSPEHQDQIRSYAERLVADGVEVIFDLWDLKPGQDQYHFMEQMVSDPSVTHVLLFCDSEYVRKADARKAGVGTESQIISPEIYEKVDQTRVIPIVCEYTVDGKACVPVFVKSRIHINFSSAEKVNENWEGLIRNLFGKPLYQRPKLGAAPSYLSESKPVFHTTSKWPTFRDALIASKSSVPFLRTDFVDSFVSEIRDLQPNDRVQDGETLENRVLTDFKNLLPLRDVIIDWLLIEERQANDDGLAVLLSNFLERLLALKYRPDGLQSWNDWWFETSGLFVCETFLYVIASLIKSERPVVLAGVLSGSYLQPEAHLGSEAFTDFSDFYTYSPILDSRNRRLSMNRVSLFADVIKERATRSDLPFRDVMQADLLLHFYSLINPGQWYPQTLVYAGYGTRFPFFVKAEQHRHFESLRIVMKAESAGDLRSRFIQAYESNRGMGPRISASLNDLLAVSKWDTRAN
jgi:hypothetical protein